MAGLFWLISPFFIKLDWFWSTPAIFFAIGGLVFPALGQSFQIFSIQRVGPALTAAIGSFVPFFAAVPAVLFLEESLGLQGTLAMTLMVGGLIFAAWPKEGVARSFPLWVLALPLGAALARGVVQPVTSAGLSIGGNAVFATLLQSSVSALVLLCLLVATGRGGQAVFAGPGKNRFLFSGLVNGLGILCVNFALMHGEVTVVAPLISTTPIWAVGFGLLGIGPERPHLRHAVVAVMVFTGALLLLSR